MMYNTEGLRQDLDLCSTERHSLNLSLSQSQDSEQNLTHRLQLSSLILTCLRQQIRDADKCPPEWTFIYRKCYFFSDERKTQLESDRFCKRNKAQLAIVKSSDTNLQWSIKSRNSEYWIGLTQKTEGSNASPAWYWPDGTKEKSMSSTQPGSCATMGTRLGVSACDVQLQWICERANNKSDLIDRMNGCDAEMQQ
ncbi:hypothetical protein XELAEV_18008572mg [Xenopus laevis]|uniref:C-type lectin domain-containing protein n=1 Tax=Xenopus laevis TaxID=8355 RepID=A0A974E4V0_XENLA|nr:hypothetical protein XELAEV_18008572mg [Xenopus laevis]